MHESIVRRLYFCVLVEHVQKIGTEKLRKCVLSLQTKFQRVSVIMSFEKDVNIVCTYRSFVDIFLLNLVLLPVAKGWVGILWSISHLRFYD